MASGSSTHRALSEGWQFKDADDPSDAWLPVTRVPTNVHLDLIANKKIPDPFIGFNERECQWVAQKTWIYRTAFHLSKNRSKGARVTLAFDGLDTFATVKLDGEVILVSDNMFVPHRIDVTERVADCESHYLTIEFDSALLRAREIKNAHPEHKWVCWNGEDARLAVRKAQYHWGWDWGPELMTCGPWRPIRLEVWTARIVELRVDYALKDSLTSASGSITVHTEGSHADAVLFAVYLDGNIVFKGNSNVDSKGIASVDFHVNKPQLWYPHGYGQQPLYEVTAVLYAKSEDKLDSRSQRIGFRTVDLVQSRDQAGRSFYFKINNIPIFCGGSNWIPGDNFTPRVSRDRYRKWLKIMVEGNQVMARVWGGGIWEEDVFYDTCDELGILVWQDFMFACGNYPAFPSFLESVHTECETNVRRLRHHPSIAIYAGNNEDYQIQEQTGLFYDYKDKNPENWLRSDFPARYIYEKLIPDVVTAECPAIPYHPGSPWGQGKLTSDPRVGDMHQWNVWHGSQEPYQKYESIGGRFNSEFGMQAFPDIKTIKYFVKDDSQLYSQSPMLDFHNKAAGHERRIAIYLSENFCLATELEPFIYLTQLCQAEALKFAYSGWRRQWDKERHCGGALVWQLNDCWPVTSWAIVDYFLRKKPAFYTIKRALAPLAISVNRKFVDWSTPDNSPAKQIPWQVSVASSLSTETIVTVEVRFVSINTGRAIDTKIIKSQIKIPPNCATDITSGSINVAETYPHVLAARLWIGDKVIARDTDWPQPFKYLSFADRGLEVISDKEYLHITAEKPVKGLVFEERDGVQLSDNCLDIVPGDKQIIQARGLADSNEPLTWRYLGQDEKPTPTGSRS